MALELASVVDTLVANTLTFCTVCGVPLNIHTDLYTECYACGAVLCRHCEHCPCDDLPEVLSRA